MVFLMYGKFYFRIMNFWNDSKSEIYIKLYDDLAAKLKTNKELSFYKKYFTKDQRLIEFGCGSGRILIPLLEKGFDLSGLDISKGMLKHLRPKLKQRKLTTKIFNKDLTNFSLKTKFDGGILSQRTLNFITTQNGQKKALINISKTLKEGSILIINLMPARVSDFSSVQKDLVRTGTFKNSQTGNEVEFWESWIPNRSTQTWNFVNEFRESGNKINTKMKMRTVFVPEMKTLLKSCGFKIVDIFGDWEGEPYTEKSKNLIFVVRKG